MCVEYGNMYSSNDAQESRPAGANVPPLGLSNKATTDGSSMLLPGRANPYTMLLFSERQSLGGSVGIRYPFESELASTTLWPEIEKIFGHGYEARPTVAI
jgi:elongator complex protein 2